MGNTKAKGDFSNQQENDIEIDLDSVKESADKKTKVMPGIRWQVFQRDNWRCVACRRSAEDGIILRVDHILPRSKGGKDEINNYQTLCFDCNIGKSNKDETDLRSGRAMNGKYKSAAQQKLNRIIDAGLINKIKIEEIASSDSASSSSSQENDNKSNISTSRRIWLLRKIRRGIYS